MTVEEKKRGEIISQLVSDLFARAKEGGDASSKIHSLREEIKKVIESEDTIIGKFLALLESFNEIIPEEKKRYNAAIKALSATSKLSKQEIAEAVNTQLEELKILEKSLLQANSGWRQELTAMEARTRETKNEIAKLRDIITRLENEEKGLLNELAAREKEMALVEKALAEVFTRIGAEIGDIKKKVEEFTVEPPVAPQPIPPAASVAKGGEEKGGNEQNTGLRKKCPMCGGRMDKLPNEMWMCYSCAYEEKGAGDLKSEILDSFAPQQAELRKKCPMCGGRMDFQLQDRKWMCYSCAYEEAKDEAQEESEDNGAKPSMAFLSSNRASKRTCPGCRKKMVWYDEERSWRCPSCGYERRI